ncbi:MAG: glycosyltransferase family 4 protein [Ardenticatenaceae bacterium]
MEALAAPSDMEVVAAVPPSWKDERGEMKLEQAHTAGYQLRVLPMRFNGSFHTHFYPSIGQLLDEVQPDLFHIDEEAYNFATFHAAWLAHRRGIPFLFFTWQNLLRRYPLPFRWMEQWIYRHAAGAIAGSRSASKVLTQKGYQGSPIIIPQFGVDLRLFEMQLRSRSASDPIVFGYAGRIVEEKGLHVLLDALAGLSPSRWRFNVRGSGPAKESLIAHAKQLGIAERVSFNPPLPSTSMPEFYHQIDVFVLPSLTRSNWKEQFGRVLIEAMASGTVVVGSDSGEISYVIGDAGLVVPEADVENLRGALRLLLNDAPLCRKLAIAGRQRVLAHFTQDAIAHQTIEVYRRIIRKR